MCMPNYLDLTRTKLHETQSFPVIFLLTAQTILAKSIKHLEPCTSCFKNQRKLGFHGYILCYSRIKKEEPRFAMFLQATDGSCKHKIYPLKPKLL